jgi:hypothetical protein
VVILAVTVVFAVRWLVRTVKGKGGCNCSGCPYSGGKECHCKDGQCKLPEIKL